MPTLHQTFYIYFRIFHHSHLKSKYAFAHFLNEAHKVLISCPPYTVFTQQGIKSSWCNPKTCIFAATIYYHQEYKEATVKLMSCLQSISDQRNYIGSKNYSQIFLYHDLSFITNLSCAWHGAVGELARTCPQELLPGQGSWREEWTRKPLYPGSQRQQNQRKHSTWAFYLSQYCNWKNKRKC